MMGDFFGLNVTDSVPHRAQKVTSYDLHSD